MTVLFRTIQLKMSTQFNCQKHFYFNLLTLVKQFEVQILGNRVQISNWVPAFVYIYAAVLDKQKELKLKTFGERERERERERKRERGRGRERDIFLAYFFLVLIVCKAISYWQLVD